MSEQEKKSGSNTGSSPAVVVDPPSRHPHRPTELQEDTPDQHHKRSRAPAVLSVAEELKTFSEDAPVSDTVGTRDRKEMENVISAEKYIKHSVAKKLSSSTKRRETPETITCATMEVDLRKGTMTPPPQPIPAPLKDSSPLDVKLQKKEVVEKRAEETDSITEEISELQTAEPKHSEWSDEEEAGGLPRSASRASRASRVSRAVRHLFCCGMPYEAPSDATLDRDQHSGI